MFLSEAFGCTCPHYSFTALERLNCNKLIYLSFKTV